jgi:hypothetical protein
VIAARALQRADYGVYTVGKNIPNPYQVKLAFDEILQNSFNETPIQVRKVITVDRIYRFRGLHEIKDVYTFHCKLLILRFLLKLDNYVI